MAEESEPNFAIPIAKRTAPVASGDFATREQVEALQESVRDLQSSVSEIKDLLKKQSATATASYTCVLPDGTLCQCQGQGQQGQSQFAPISTSYSDSSDSGGGCANGQCGNSGGVFHRIFHRRNR